MPEGYTHVRTARQAAAEVPFRLRCPAAFAAGANGPDSLFVFEVWKKPARRRANLPRIGERMHHERTGQFLLSLLNHVSTEAQIEYALGFLSHYATDAVVHPYVTALTAPGMPYHRKGGHGYFEAALDSTLHKEDTGDACVLAEDSNPELTGRDLSEVVSLLHTCLKEVYGEDVSAECLADAFYQIWLARKKVFCSRHHIRYALVWLVEPIVAKRGFITAHMTPRRLKKNLPEQWTDAATGAERTAGVETLLAQAQACSKELMSGALEYWRGTRTKKDLLALMGSRDYETGSPTAASTGTEPPKPAKAPAETKAGAAAQEGEAATPSAAGCGESASAGEATSKTPAAEPPKQTESLEATAQTPETPKASEKSLPADTKPE